MALEELAVVVVVATLASTVQTVAGFGFALLAVPLMSLGVDTKTAVLVASLLGTVNNLLQFSGDWGGADRAIAKRLIVGAYAGMPIGLAVLVLADPDWLRLVVGVAVLAFTFVLARGLDLSTAHPATDWAAGFVSGVLNTSISTNGPPLVIVLQGRRLAPHPFRATVSMVFVLSSVFGLLLFTVANQWTSDSLLGSAVGLPTLALGGVLGRWLRPHVDGERFRRAVLVLLTVSGVAALWASAAALG